VKSAESCDVLQNHLQWSRQLPCSVEDRRGWCPSARIPRTKCFNRDTKGRRAFRLRQVEPCPDLSQSRSALGHRSRRCHWPPRTGSEWTAMRIEVPTASGSGLNPRKVFQSAGCDRSRLRAGAPGRWTDVTGTYAECGENGAPAETRTRDPRLRRTVLYPTELPPRSRTRLKCLVRRQLATRWQLITCDASGVLNGRRGSESQRRWFRTSSELLRHMGSDPERGLKNHPRTAAPGRVGSGPHCTTEPRAPPGASSF
jgi:hypothetical protein